MTTITPVYVQTQPQQTRSKHKVQAQVGNIVTGGLGLGAISGGVNRVHRLGYKFPKLDSAFTTFAKKVGGIVGTTAAKVEKISAKFNPALRYGLLKSAEVLNNIAKEFKCDARKAVGKYMFAPAVILTVAGIVGKTIFNAGKISAE